MTTRDNRIVFHVGYPKCGSTTLQRNLFLEYSSLNFISPLDPALRSEPQAQELIDVLMGRVAVDPGRLEGLWSSFAAPRLAADKVNVFSEENFLVESSHPREALQRMHSVAPDAHLLFITRRHQDLLRSLYDMYPFVDDGRNKSFATMAQWFDFYRERPTSIVNQIRFADAVEAALDLFPPDRVVHFQFEELFRDVDLQRDFAELLGIPLSTVMDAFAKPVQNTAAQHAGKKLTRRLAGPLRASNYLDYSTIRRINSFVGRLTPSRKTTVDEGLSSRISEYYESDVQRLSRYVLELGPRQRVH